MPARTEPYQRETGLWAPVRRRDPAVARVIGSWQRLTGGARTLVACSGGADSTALLLMLRAATDALIVGHVVHDLRPESETDADRVLVERLASACGVAFAWDAVRVPPGNAEGQARRVRYAALARLAAAHGCGYVASGHHAGDQLEGVVMALVRGAGVRGLGGARESREIVCASSGARAILVRPALRVSRGELEEICDACRVPWRVDPTNLEPGRVRADLRRGVLAEIEAMRPGAAPRAARCAEAVRDAAGLVEDRANMVFGEAHDWDRDALRAERAVVVAAGLRAAFARITGGDGLDRLGGASLDAAVRAVRDRNGSPRAFDWPRGVRVNVGASRVRMTRAVRA